MAEEQKHVLVVDDATLVRAYYRQILEAAGYRVDEALNGLEALEKIHPGSHDFLIVDINMPQMDGLTFIRELRRRSAPEGSIPALVTSTEAAPQDRSAARAAGANYYLVKPVNEGALRDCVAMLCGRADG